MSKLRIRHKNKIIWGVLSGISYKFSINLTLLRIILIVYGLFRPCDACVLYLILYFCML